MFAAVFRSINLIRYRPKTGLIDRLASGRVVSANNTPVHRHQSPYRQHQRHIMSDASQNTVGDKFRLPERYQDGQTSVWVEYVWVK